MPPWSRRTFLRDPAALGIETRQLRLIHTNDHHSRIEPVGDVTIGKEASGARVTRDMGGVARRKTLFDQIRNDTSWATHHAFSYDCIFLDAGDVFQGTCYFSQYQGRADQWFYNRLGYAAQVIGNHEFDMGDQALADFIAGATYPILAANMRVAAPSPLAMFYAGDLVSTPGMWGKRTIITLPSGEQVGIFGLTTVETVSISHPSPQVSFDPNYAVVANAQAAALRAVGCSTVIALTHIGYDADMALAPHLRGVNLIVGGHSHTPLLPDGSFPYGIARVDSYPQIVTDRDGSIIVVVQGWEWAKWVGDLVIGFDAQGRVTSVSGTVTPIWAGGIAADRGLLHGEGAEIPPDAIFQHQIDAVYRPAITALSTQRVGASRVELSHANARVAESALGNLLADAIRDRVARFSDNPNGYPVVSILNGGCIRASLPAGALSVGQIIEVMPFGNTISRVDLTGAQLKAALENGVSALQPGAALDVSRNGVGSDRFSHVSGLRYVINPRGTAAQPALAATASAAAVPAHPGSRIVSVGVREGDAYRPLDPARIYRVATLNFMLKGGDGYQVFSPHGDQADPAVGGGVNQFNSGLIDADVVQEYIRAQPHGTVAPQIEGRISLQPRSHLVGGKAATVAAPAGVAGMPTGD